MEHSAVSWLPTILVPSIPKQYKIIGNTIREHRKEAHLTQEKLAELADLHPNYLGEIERGETMVSLLALIRLAAALKVRVRDLVANI